jgi:rod shape determining protein RodA
MIEAVDNRARGLRERRREEMLDVLSVARRLDWLLLLATLGLVAFGLWAIDGITQHDPGGSGVGRQAVYAGVGLVGLVVTAFVDPSVYRRGSRALYVALLAVMAIVLLGGAATRGSRRWIDAGPLRLQPSEFGKVVLAIVLAAYLADRVKREHDLKVALKTVALAAGPVVLVFLQPDIGTALVFIAVLAAVLFVSGIRWAYLGGIAAVGLLVVLAILWWLPASGVNVLKPYQAQRLTGFLNPSSDPAGATYNVNQSITAVGAGRARGRGVAGATQTRLDYLPEHATDFAFASLAEERGFFGTSILLLLYLLIVWRALKIVTSARDMYSAIVAGGLAFMFLFQVFVNAAMTMGIAPITGIPLPFVSVGGSSMITNFFAVAVLEAIYLRRPVRRHA